MTVGLTASGGTLITLSSTGQKNVPFSSTSESFGGCSISNDSNGDPTIFNLPTDEGYWALEVNIFIDQSQVGDDLGFYLEPGTTGNTLSEWHSYISVVDMTPTLRFIFRPLSGYPSCRISAGTSRTGVRIGGRVARLVRIDNPDSAYAQFDGNSTAQSIAGSTDTVAAYGGTVTSSSDVTRATDGAGHKFTLNRAGLWTITTTQRFVTGSAGERYASIQSDQYGSMAVVTADGGYSNGSTPETMSLSYTGHFDAGKSVRSVVWQTGNTTLNLDASNIWKNISLSLVSPD